MSGALLNKKLSKSDLKKLAYYLESNQLLSLFELHGYLTAIVSGPEMIMPSIWMDFLGLNDGEFDSMEEAQEILGSIMALYNDICTQLKNRTFRIITIKAQQSRDQKQTAKELWAKGYLLAVNFDQDSWLTNDEISSLMLPIVALRFADEVLQELLDRNRSDITIEQLKQYGYDQLSEAAIAVYDYWLKQRNPSAPVNYPLQPKLKIGRNDPCACGSGKKYKKCCLVLH